MALGQDPGPVNATSVTIEHILPRGYAQKSGWRRHFPSEKVVQAHSHKLGNLTFLTAADNQTADTLDWQDKRPIYARSKARGWRTASAPRPTGRRNRSRAGPRT